MSNHFVIPELKELGCIYYDSEPPLQLPKETIDYYGNNISRVYGVSKLEASWALYYVCLLSVSTIPNTRFEDYVISSQITSAMPFRDTPIHELLLAMVYA